MATFTKRTASTGTTSWNVRIRKRGYPIQSKTFRTKALAPAWARKLESEMDSGSFQDTKESAVPFSEALSRYLEEMAAKPIARNDKSLTARLTASLGVYTLLSITPRMLADFRDKLAEEGLAPQTVRHHLGLVSRVYTAAIKEWYLPLPNGNPVTKVKLPLIPQGRDRRVSDDELVAIKANLRPDLRHVVDLALYTGMRRGEICRIKREDLSGLVLNIPITKNGHSRSIPLLPKALSALRGLLLLGGIPPSQVISKGFREACRAAGIEGVVFHSLRHEATSRFFERGLNMMEVASITGHRDLKMLQRYTHLKASDLLKKLEAL